jgi:hypothetical protein
MEKHVDYIGVYDNAATPQFCREVIAEFERLQQVSGEVTINPQSSDDGGKQFANAALGRKDVSAYFDVVSESYSAKIHDIICKCLSEYGSEYIGLNGVPLVSYTCKVQRTDPKGGFHVWHHEHGSNLSSMRRALVWALYLTDHEEEGETEFLQQGIRVEPRAGRVVLWPASFTHPHRGNPVYNSVKYIATGWFEKLAEDVQFRHNGD